MTTVKEYTKNIKACIGEICINIHRKSKDQDTLDQLMLINSNVFMISCELHTHGRETKEIEKLMSDLELFYWDMLFIDKTKEEPFTEAIKTFKEITEKLKRKLEIMYKFVQAKNIDVLFFENLIKANSEGKL